MRCLDVIGLGFDKSDEVLLTFGLVFVRGLGVNVGMVSEHGCGRPWEYLFSPYTGSP